MNKNDEAKISPEIIKEIKEGLEKRKKQILEDLRDISSKKGDKYKVKMPEYGDDCDENAQETSDYSANLATEEILVKTLHDIEHTLKIIDSKKYGICKYCGNPINEKRLLARPTTSTCINCKTKLQNND